MRAAILFLRELSHASIENVLKQRLFRQLVRKDYASVSALHSGEWMNRLTSDTVVVAITLTGDNTLTGMQGIGGIVGTGFDLISDCEAAADIIVMGDGGACAGIIAGGTTMSSIKGCTANGGSITADGNNVWGIGGLCGAPWGAAEIIDCKASDVVISILF